MGFVAASEAEIFRVGHVSKHLCSYSSEQCGAMGGREKLMTMPTKLIKYKRGRHCEQEALKGVTSSLWPEFKGSSKNYCYDAMM